MFRFDCSACREVEISLAEHRIDMLCCTIYVIDHAEIIHTVYCIKPNTRIKSKRKHSFFQKNVEAAGTTSFVSL